MAKLPIGQRFADRTLVDRDDLTDDRVSIWDIRIGWRDRFWAVFSVQTLFAAIFEGWFELQFGSEPTAWHQTRSIITNTVPYIVLIGPSSYMITEGIVMLSERYLKWRRRQSLEALAGWLTRRDQAWRNGETFKELIPDTVEFRHIEANMKQIQAGPESLPENWNGAKSEELDASALKMRVLEMEAWYGRKRLAEDRGETFSEPFPSGNGAHHSQN